MASIFDVAKYILKEKGKLGPWRLHKLCYYSQAWHMAWTEEELFSEDFEAWRTGPVCRELYNAVSHFNDLTLTENCIQGDVSRLSEDQIDSINVILREYGNMAPWEIAELARNDMQHFNVSVGDVIPKAVICNYYAGSIEE